MAPLLAQKPGVDRAFERLYRRHALDVYRYAFAVLRNQADAEDVAQTTFMNAYRALERGETPTTPHNWLIAIAHNVCRQRFRQQSRRVQEVNLDEDVADHFVQPEDDDTPAPEDIKRALGHLAFNQRAALVMRELEGRSYAEIADLLDLSVSAVETLIFRARRALREQLEGTLTCGQAEQFLSRQLDAQLAKQERGQLRAHLRECAACRKLARSQRAQRSALRALGSIPLPSSLASLFGGTAPVAAKVAAVVVTATVAGGVGYDVHHQFVQPRHAKHTPARQAVVPQQTQTTAQRVSNTAAPRVPIVGAVVKARIAPKHPHATPVTTPATPATPASAGDEPATPAVPATPARPQHPATPKPAQPETAAHGKPATAGAKAKPKSSPKAQAAKEKAKPTGGPPADSTATPGKPDKAAKPDQGSNAGGNSDGNGQSHGGQSTLPTVTLPSLPPLPDPAATVTVPDSHGRGK